VPDKACTVTPTQLMMLFFIQRPYANMSQKPYKNRATSPLQASVASKKELSTHGFGTFDRT
jgi:hypothetical protein